MKILMCVPNISEGKDMDLVEQVIEEIRSVKGALVIDHSSDADHNRSVLTYLGEPEAVLNASKAMAAKAIELIDMSKQQGSHPRMGAVDVVPFIPVRGIKTEEAVEIAKQFGKYLGSLGVPVYYYEDAATRTDRILLTTIRKGEYEALAEKLKDPQWAPDEGPAQFNAKSGATVTGARFALIALNVNLRCDDISIAQNIAKAVRHINGGFRFVRAIGLTIEDQGMVQVSMNLTNYRKTPIPRVLETIRSEARRYGVSVAGSELVGPVPLGALEEPLKHYLQVHAFSMSQIIENSILDTLQ
ncbi:MAG: glutamate formimidoyltransferase [Desulfobacterales bacterium]|jgi:glutamate formiminotransferase